jgi:hypothetical protein
MYRFQFVRPACCTANSVSRRSSTKCSRAPVSRQIGRSAIALQQMAAAAYNFSTSSKTHPAAQHRCSWQCRRVCCRFGSLANSLQLPDMLLSPRGLAAAPPMLNPHTRSHLSASTFLSSGGSSEANKRGESGVRSAMLKCSCISVDTRCAALLQHVQK